MGCRDDVDVESMATLKAYFMVIGVRNGTLSQAMFEAASIDNLMDTIEKNDAVSIFYARSWEEASNRFDEHLGID
jgi:hypothetical protein